MLREIRIPTILAALAAGPAAAGSFEGGTVAFAMFNANGGEYSVNELSGSAVFRLNDRLLVQGDLSHIGEFDEDNYGVHLIYSASADVALGVFYNRDQLSAYGFDQIGAEVKTALDYEGRPLTLSGFLSTENDDGPFGLTYNYVGVRLAAPIAQDLTLTGTVASVWESADVDVATGALRYDAGKGIYAELSYTTTSGDFDKNSLGFEVGYDFGSGPIFADRTWASLFHGL